MTMNSDKNFRIGLDSTKIAKDSWNRDKVISAKDHTIGGIILIWRTLHQVCLNAKQRLNEQITDVRNTFTKDLADKKVADLKSEYNQFIEESQRNYKNHVNMVCDEKLAEIDRLISKTSDPDLAGLIQNLNMRTEVSDREWYAIVARVSASHDYQAMRMLSDVAIKFNREFAVPFDPDKKAEAVETARTDLLNIGKILDKEDKDFGYIEMLITGKYSEPTARQKSYLQIDQTVGVAVPEKEIPLLERLKEASEIARQNGDNETANKISRFIYEKATLFENRQVIESIYREEAEKLITAALTTK